MYNYNYVCLSYIINVYTPFSFIVYYNMLYKWMNEAK